MYIKLGHTQLNISQFHTDHMQTLLQKNNYLIRVLIYINTKCIVVFKICIFIICTLCFQGIKLNCFLVKALTKVYKAKPPNTLRNIRLN